VRSLGWCAAALLIASCAGDQGNERDASVADGADVEDADAGLGPPYPIVLAHGFFGFEEFAGVEYVTYFFGVRDALAAEGEVLVYTPAVDPFNDSETRGAQLLAHVERILAETGHSRVNIVGHSQGGLDARYVAHARPDLVASVTTFATPHQGTPIADVVLGIVEDPRARDLADRLVQVIGAPLWDAAGEETSVFAALRQFSSEGVLAFNAEHTDAPGVAYYSVTGRTDFHRGGSDCMATDAPPFVTDLGSVLDPVDPLLDIPEQIIDGGIENDVNDGLVRARDARWGRFLGCVPADHLDEIGQILGDDPGLGNRFDHRAFHVALVAWLRAQGH
jgi:triacylglycerol lipase